MGLDVFGHPDQTKRKRTSVQLWNRPRRWNREAQEAGVPARVFCMSLGDFFEDAPGPNAWRDAAWEVIHDTPWLDWQILTKRPENIERMLPDSWADNAWGFWPNVWLGTSIEDQRVAHREHELTLTPAWVHFVSYEPAIGPLAMTLQRIEWVIVGGESGPGWRKMDLDWARQMQSDCAASINPRGTAYFFKQDSAPRTEMGIDALGAIYRDYPTSWDRSEMKVA
jgi:protein gp37